MSGETSGGLDAGRLGERLGELHDGLRLQFAVEHMDLEREESVEGKNKEKKKAIFGKWACLAYPSFLR